MRLGDPQRTMLGGTVLSIVLIAITPLLGGIFVLLLLAQGVRGWLDEWVFGVTGRSEYWDKLGAVVHARLAVRR